MKKLIILFSLITLVACTTNKKSIEGIWIYKGGNKIIVERVGVNKYTVREIPGADMLQYVLVVVKEHRMEKLAMRDNYTGDLLTREYWIYNKKKDVLEWTDVSGEKPKIRAELHRE